MDLMGCTKNYALNYRSWYKCVGSEGEREREGVLYTIDKSTHSVRRKISGIELKPLRNGKEKELGLKGSPCHTLNRVYWPQVRWCMIYRSIFYFYKKYKI
jgi:hypothetical protein